MMSGRKRAQCRICSKFFRADYLERHMETHRKSKEGNNDPRWFERLANMISENVFNRVKSLLNAP